MLERIVATLGPWSQGNDPIYRRLAESLAGAIKRGELEIGSRLPAERPLAQALALSRSTVVSAYDLLEQDGWIARKRGSGTIVAASARAGVPDRDALITTVGRNAAFAAPAAIRHLVIDFTTGSPRGKDEVALDDLVLERAEVQSLIEEGGYSSSGLPALRAAVAARYTQRGLTTSPDQILITAGAQQAIMLAAMLFVRSGDNVLIENPTYFGAIDAFRSAEARFVPIDVDQDGASTERLRALLSAHSARVIYTVPTLHNPTGTIMPEHRRREFARIVDDLHVPLVEDETLAELAFDGVTPKPIAAFVRSGTVVTIGSLSKLVWAGLRIGWMRAPQSIIERLMQLKAVSDLGTSVLSQAIAVRVFGTLDAAKARRCAYLPERLRTLTDALHEALPSWSVLPTRGGYFIWVKLPTGDAHQFAQVALRQGVRITPGADMSINGSCREYARLSYMNESARIREGVQRLAAAWREYEPHASGARRELDLVV